LLMSPCCLNRRCGFPIYQYVAGTVVLLAKQNF
jgi:hypothetical protein